jgi:hypothetical protein
MTELRGDRPPRQKPDDPGRLSPDQPVWEVGGDRREAEEGNVGPPGPALGGATPARTWRQAPGRRSGGGRRLLAILLALGLFAAGIVVGSLLAGRSTERARPTAAATSVAPSTAAPTTTAAARQLAPPACLSAVDDADAVISYLVANVRDQRLARTLQQYRVASRTCRRAS